MNLNLRSSSGTLVIVIVAVIVLLTGFKNKSPQEIVTQDKRFIEVTVKNYIVVHGYDSKNKVIEEYVTNQLPRRKLFAIDKIQSVSDKYILTTHAYNRVIYWEYEGGYESIRKQLSLAESDERDG